MTATEIINVYNDSKTLKENFIAYYEIHNSDDELIDFVAFVENNAKKNIGINKKLSENFYKAIYELIYYLIDNDLYDRINNILAERILNKEESYNFPIFVTLAADVERTNYRLMDKTFKKYSDDAKRLALGVFNAVEAYKGKKDIWFAFADDPYKGYPMSLDDPDYVRNEDNTNNMFLLRTCEMLTIGGILHVMVYESDMISKVFGLVKAETGQFVSIPAGELQFSFTILAKSAKLNVDLEKVEFLEIKVPEEALLS